MVGVFKYGQSFSGSPIVYHTSEQVERDKEGERLFVAPKVPGETQALSVPKANQSEPKAYQSHSL